ncbi:MAG: malto-oligosyltrehalose trehalohydrolase [Gemmatimonadales bacterium]
MTLGWTGARCEPGGARFRVWAPGHTTVEVLLEPTGDTVRLAPAPDGMFEGFIPGPAAGDRYRYLVDGAGPWPDPASRAQPDGVHGPSQLVDPAGYEWTDQQWTGRGLPGLVLYELHVGTFTPEGTFAAAAGRLARLRDLGVTGVELMPVAAFGGRRNWGYDGVALYAPAPAYGTPEDLRRLVDTAHGLDLAVHLDVVYNHLGPDGNYLGRFSDAYFSPRHRTPWGEGINFDGPGSGMVREFFVQNAEHWIREYHIDGLRLDATHVIVDESPRHVLAELAERVRDVAAPRTVLVIAEDHRNLAHMVRPEADGGWGLDAVWSDDFHHELRRIVAGDDDGYFADFTGSARGLATTLRQGWFFTGQPSAFYRGLRGTDPGGISLRRFVTSVQNHDQVGNRPLGTRLQHDAGLPAFSAAVMLQLTAPETPLLFMGQEWAASTPFLYFTDHHAELGRLVTEGRRREFARFRGYSSPASRGAIPDPQDPGTFERCRLVWEESLRPPHAGIAALHAALLRLRASHPGLRNDTAEVRAVGDDAIVMQRGTGPDRVAVVVRLRGSGPIPADAPGTRTLLDTEAFLPDPVPAEIDSGGAVRFARPGGVVLARQNP